MAVDAAWILDLAASLPDTGEREYLEESVAFTFRGRGIGYVSSDGRHLFVKSTLAERDAMVLAQPDVYAAWYTSGRFGWVRASLDRIEAEEARELVVEAWRLTAPQRLVRQWEESAGVGVRP